MSNVLNEEKQQQVLALGRLGWPLRRIQQETGVRRETASAYLKAAGIPVRSPGAWGKRPPRAKPANEVSPDSDTPAAADRRPGGSRCEPYLEFIEASLAPRRTGMRAVCHNRRCIVENKAS